MNEEKISKNNHPAPKSFGWVGILLIIVIIAMGGLSYYLFQMITQKNQQLSVLSEEKTSLESEKQTLSTSVAEITDTINGIAAKLLDVRQKSVIITELAAQYTEGSQKDNILNDINMIEAQLERDKSDIEDLSQKMQVSGIKIKSLETLVGNLRKEIVAHVERIENLRSIVENKDEIIKTTENTLQDTKQTLSVVQSELEQTSGELDVTRNTLEETRNTAFYVIGTKNELLGKNVIDEKGWFVFNKEIDLSTEISENAFDKIDITSQNEFPIACNMKHVKILPERSISSYTLREMEDDQSVLTITDPEKFWKIKYLAVLISG